MTTSVPSVHPIADIKWRIASLLEKAFEIYRTTGDIELLAKTIALARELLEELKLEAHKGRIDWAYIKRYTASLEQVERFIVKVRARAKAKQ